MVDLQVTGADKFVAVAKALRQAGDRELKRELGSAIKQAVAPMTDEVRVHIAQYLPDNYAAVLAKSLKTRQSWRTSGSTVGLMLTGSAKGRSRRRAVQAINRGTLRHKVFGHPEVWVDQRVKPGFWDEPLIMSKGKPAKEIQKALDRVAQKLARKY